MKNLIFAFVVLFSLNLHAAITLVSDLDDTIKITNSGKEVDGTINAVFSNDVFTGMPDFLNTARAYVDEVHVLSAFPGILRLKIKNTFKKKGISVDSLILRGTFDRTDIPAYKVRELKKLIEKNSGDDFILIGDDVSHDPEVYDEMIRTYPNRILASYIHVIKGRDLPKSATKYWTTYDLYLREYIAGRMQKIEVEDIAKKTLEEDKLKLIFPRFASCPKTPEIWLWHLRTAFALQSASVAKKLNWYCLSRWSDIPFP